MQQIGIYRVLRKFKDIAVLLITLEIMTTESLNFTGLKDCSVSRYSQSNNLNDRTLF